MRTGKMSAALLAGCAVFFVSCAAQSQRDWPQRVFFDNSISPRSYFYSAGNVSAPSKLEIVDKKLPVETSNFVSGPNSLRLSWLSAPNGGWDAEVRLPTWANRAIDYKGDTLYLWLYSATPLPARALPKIGLRDSTNSFTELLPLGSFAHDLAASTWQRVTIPLARFPSASVRAFEPRPLNDILLGEAEIAPHRLVIYEVRI